MLYINYALFTKPNNKENVLAIKPMYEQILSVHFTELKRL